jgi:hypothetical protein
MGKALLREYESLTSLLDDRSVETINSVLIGGTYMTILFLDVKVVTYSCFEVVKSSKHVLHTLLLHPFHPIADPKDGVRCVQGPGTG